MQFAHAIEGMVHADKNRRRYRDKSLDVTESDFEPLSPAAYFFDRLKRRRFASLQLAWRGGGQMSRYVRQIGMQFLPEVFHKFPDSISHISHQGVTGILHVNWKLYLRRRQAWLQPADLADNLSGRL